MPVRKPRTKETAENEPEIIKRFRKIFPELNPPSKESPVAPLHVTKLSSEQLGDMVSMYTAWREFTEDQLVTAAAVLSICQEAYDFEVSKFLAKAGKDDASVTIAKAKAEVSPTVVEKATPYIDADVYKNMLARKLESYTNVLTMLSRELTRRGINTF